MLSVSDIPIRISLIIEAVKERSTEPRVPSGSVEVAIMPWFWVLPLRNIYVTYDHGYVPISQSRLFLFHDLSSNFQQE